MTRPLLSIVTISFNQKQFLRQTLDSVLAQKTSDVEYIVVDGGSNDGSLELIAEYGEKIDHVITGRDLGPADGLNKGFAKASGQIGYFLNSDDFLLPHSVKTMCEFWQSKPEASVFLAGGWMVNGGGQPLRELRPTATTPQGLLDGTGKMVQQGLSFSLDIFRNAGGFNVHNRTCWDLELLCRMLATPKLAALSKQRIGAFRLHGDSLTGGAAGLAHQAKYQADLARLRDEFEVAQRPFNWLHYANSMSLLLDKLMPSRVAKRFALDCLSHEN